MGQLQDNYSFEWSILGITIEKRLSSAFAIHNKNYTVRGLFANCFGNSLRKNYGKRM
jgi:hypothetical protein